MGITPCFSGLPRTYGVVKNINSTKLLKYIPGLSYGKGLREVRTVVGTDITHFIKD